MPVNMTRGLLSTGVSWKLAAVEYMATLIAGLYMTLGGIQHILDPSVSLTASVLARVGLDVTGALALSVGGFVTLFVILVGLTLFLSGVVLLIGLGGRLVESIA